MKKTKITEWIFFIFMTIWFLSYSTEKVALTQTPGGSDASGGGDGLRIKIRMGKVLATSALMNIEPQMLKSTNLSPEALSLYQYIRTDLARDLSQSSLIFREPRERHLFFLNGEEKTAMTQHKPTFPIEINLARCDELEIKEMSAAVLLMREGARHLGMSDNPTLDQIEDLGTIVINTYLGQNPTFFASQEYPVSLNAATHLGFKYIYPNEVQKNGEITYISQNLFHYYLMPGQFDTESSELILATFRYVESFFEDLGFPIHFEFRGNYELPSYEYQYGYYLFGNERFLGDTYNVLSHSLNTYPNYDETNIYFLNYEGIQFGFDLNLNHEIHTTSRVEDYYGSKKNFYIPCLCTVMTKKIFQILTLHKMFPWIEKNMENPNEPHEHFDIIKSFTPIQIQTIQSYLRNRVVIVKNSPLELIHDYRYYQIFRAPHGYYIKFTPGFLSQIKTNEDVSIDVTIIKSLWWDELLFHRDLESMNGSYNNVATDALYVTLPDMSRNDPDLTYLFKGKLKVLELPQNRFDRDLEIQISLDHGSHYPLHDPFDTHSFTLPKWTPPGEHPGENQ